MFYAILFFLLRLPSLFEPYWYGDEGIYLTIGQALRHGLLLFQQIHDNKPPTLYYLAALAHTVFGFRLLLFLVMIPTVYVFYLLSKKILVSRLSSQLSTLLFLILTSIPLFEGNIANAEVFMLLPTILAVYIFYKYSSVSGLPAKALASAGLLLGLAFTIKVPVAIEFAFLCLWLLIFYKSKLKNLFIFSFSFLVPITLYLIYFALKGALQPFLFAALLQNFGYLSSWSTGNQQASVASGGLINRGIVLLILWLISFLLFHFKKISKNIFFLSSWFFAALFGALLSGRPYPHYLIQVLPPLCLLLFFFLKSKLWVLFVFSLFTVSLFRYKFYFYPVLPYYLNFYSYALGKKNTDNYRQYFGYEVSQNYLLASKIKSLTSPSDKIYVWGDQSYLFPLSDRLPATKYLVSYHVVDFKAHDLTISQLKLTTPKLIIYYPQPSRPFPQLDDFIANYYVLIDQIGSAYLFKFRD
ncbi:MAG TPA: hypothetical protein PKI92_02255 [Candidatus Woesebacteria bacterium]|nr:hypothetical protein [Candidatus Woesebacteria bacterium]HPR99785.1 hypothetical protein [Candidatus Woesebacteria bacterium]